jgi:hypothetical protein
MNSTSIPNAPTGGTNNDIIIACVAMSISTVALFIALLQALQQYYASATGYASCKELVMGNWSKFTHRRLRLFEFRFEVEFQTPVIFVSAPTNIRGPLGPHIEEEEQSTLRYLHCSIRSKFTGTARLHLQDKPQEICRHEITYMVGTQDSYQKTYTWSQDMYDERIRCLKAGETRQAIRTADNELATWLTLLMAIQRMERESRQWQAEMFFGYNVTYNEWCNRALHTPLVGSFDTKDVNNLHTLTVGMQKKKRSWDTMPEHMKKPYATSTICHIVEIIAMLGIHWKVFNRNENLYRAQGNGFLVTGANVDDLGIVFSFHKTGQTWFKENRIIPDENVKELCFGYCPTIFRPRNLEIYAEEPKDIGTLQLASFTAMAETLKVIGCNTKTVKYFSKSVEDTRHSHLFPGVSVYFLNSPEMPSGLPTLSGIRDAWYDWRRIANQGHSFPDAPQPYHSSLGPKVLLPQGLIGRLQVCLRRGFQISNTRCSRRTPERKGNVHGQRSDPHDNKGS